jgi:hypothetical protein
MGGRRRDRGRRGVERECVSVRGGKSKKERGVGQEVLECVIGREREIKRVGRVRESERKGGDVVGRGICMREREER